LSHYRPGIGERDVVDVYQQANREAGCDKYRIGTVLGVLKPMVSLPHRSHPTNSTVSPLTSLEVVSDVQLKTAEAENF
jgi:hypothetical protein